MAFRQSGGHPQAQLEVQVGASAIDVCNRSLLVTAVRPCS
jgi:hypothetical protein